MTPVEARAGGKPGVAAESANELAEVETRT